MTEENNDNKLNIELNEDIAEGIYSNLAKGVSCFKRWANKVSLMLIKIWLELDTH